MGLARDRQSGSGSTRDPALARLPVDALTITAPTDSQPSLFCPHPPRPHLTFTAPYYSSPRSFPLLLRSLDHSTPSLSKHRRPRLWDHDSA